MSDLPPATSSICNDCPWRRESVPGWLGPYPAREWIQAVHSDAPIACHQTIVTTDDDGEGDWSDGRIRQCLGSAVYRANVGKLPRDPAVARADSDRERVFSSDAEFIEHHNVRRSRA